ncbi:HlyD family efflux transporter periplasmic adaptor subunit [Pseudoalteromonas sp. SMS1]|uniref:HlyD family secretion protein n=1 Tax=Pseudoalteromonas sp. SMS1 TaxID=2908894 RepID=UPI001F20B79E|nr:HlyD family efflux transporter periplasmic adaptor subunit [Pseudoalteromonas sp. SMS1]MCF2859723.1 HlyD family efflux transporter periplasmic adaptor subunit [Pseudoalteromonas sp. SMS1]
MDIKIPSHKSSANRYRWVIYGCICLFASGVLFYITASSAIEIERDSLIIAPVMRGPLTRTIDAFGKLQSAHQQTITTLSAGTVTSIVNKAGQAVVKGEVIVILKNDDLVFKQAQTQQQLLEMRVQLEQQKILQHRERLTEQATLDELKGELATLQFRYQAQHELAQQGVISKYVFFQTQASLDSTTQRLVYAETRMRQLSELHQHECAIIENKIALKVQELTVLDNKVAALMVRAPSDGVIEQMPLGLGEQVQSGGYIATLGNQKAFTAVLHVGQLHGQQIQLGQRVEIKVGDEVVTAEITRIDPVVTNHSIVVEARLPPQIPTAARLKLSITASIIIEHLQDVVYIRRPANQLTLESGLLYNVLDTQETELLEVVFGVDAGRYIVVEQGLSVGQNVIISDLNSLALQGATIAIK